jgi:hypothetical protein
MLRSSLNAIAAALLVALLQGCASLSSEPDLDSLAFQRTSQQRAAKELSAEDAKAYAVWAVPFSRVASHVYCKYLSGNVPDKASREDCKSFPELSDTGWKQLYDWRSILTEDEGKSGLEFMAFGRADSADRGEIVIGFRGTDFTSLSDWRSNLRWITRFLPLPGHDQYQIVHAHAQQLVDLALASAKESFPLAAGFDVYSSGHSLGGGLAQLLAYSDSRVKAAVVFDPSPVTGYSTLVSNEQVNCAARVVRIYERGEALQYVRSVLRRFYSLSANIYEVSFDLLHARGNPVANHSMTGFRGGLEARAKVSTATRMPVTVALLPQQSDCGCYRDRRPGDLSEDAAVCRAPVAGAGQ